MEELLKDFELHVNTIERWVKSCDKSDQLPICSEVINSLIVDRFLKYIGDGLTKTDYLNAIHKLESAIDEQALIIAASQSNTNVPDKLQSLN